MRATHPPFDDPGITKRLQHFAHRGEILLRAHHHDGIILARDL
jgi:hypothetical protein